MKPLALLALLALGCRAAPIPDALRYPAGTLPVRYARLEGSLIRVIDIGSGTPVIFIHGIGESVYAWRKNLPAVAAAGFRAIAYDNRGFGSSEKPDTGYRPSDYRGLLEALLDTLGIADCVLVGHSMGGEIAADFALEHPGRVRGLVLVDAAGLGVRVPRGVQLGARAVVGLAMPLRSRSLVAWFVRSTYADPTRVSPEDIDQYYAPIAEAAFARSFPRALRDFPVDALRGRLAELRPPTLVLWGARDRWIPATIGASFAAAIPRSAFVLVPEAGHAVQEEAPERVNRLLLSFLREAVPGTPANMALGWSTALPGEDN